MTCRKKLISVLAVVLAAAGMSACGPPHAYLPAEETGEVSYSGIEIYLPGNSLQQGETMTALLLVIHNEGDKSICDDGSALWESSDENVAVIDETGIVTGMNPGGSDLRVRWNGFETTRPVIVTRAVDYSNILLNEVFYDDTGTDTGREFIELCNRNNYDCDLSGFMLVDGSSSSSPFIFPDGSVLPASGIIIVAQSADEFISRFGYSPHYAGFSFTLNNSGETVFLKFPDETVRDSVYIEGGSAEFPPPPGWGSVEYPAAGEGTSIRRESVPDSDTWTDWSEESPSPGY